MVNRDIFDEVAEEKDIFSQVQSTEESSIEKLKSDLSDLVDRLDSKERKSEKAQMTAQVMALVKSEISKIKPVQNVIERTLEKQVVKNIHVPVNLPNPVIPPQKVREIIREVRIEAKDDGKEYAETKTVDGLKKQIEELKKGLEESKKQTSFLMGMRGGSGVIGIPPPEGNPEGYVLTISGGKQKWKVATGGSGGGIAPGTFSISNPTQNFSLDVKNATVDQLYQVVGTLIQKLQGDI